MAPGQPPAVLRTPVSPSSAFVEPGLRPLIRSSTLNSNACHAEGGLGGPGQAFMANTCANSRPPSTLRSGSEHPSVCFRGEEQGCPPLSTTPFWCQFPSRQHGASSAFSPLLTAPLPRPFVLTHAVCAEALVFARVPLLVHPGPAGDRGVPENTSVSRSLHSPASHPRPGPQQRLQVELKAWPWVLLFPQPCPSAPERAGGI